MLPGVEQAEADGRDALDALVHESDALKARKAAAGERALQRTLFWGDGHIWAGRLTFCS